MLSVQKSSLDNTSLGFVDSIFVSETHSTNFVSSSETPKIEIVKPVEVTSSSRKIKVDLKESNPKNPNLRKDKKHDRRLWVCFCEKVGHTRSNCFKLQAAKRANKPKVLVPQAQDPIILIGELVKALNLYSNPRVVHYSNMNNNSKAKVASKRFWIQKAQSNWVFLTWSLCFIALLFVTILLCCFCFICFWDLHCITFMLGCFC